VSLVRGGAATSFDLRLRGIRLAQTGEQKQLPDFIS
jgi:hypothetical protein